MKKILSTLFLYIFLCTDSVIASDMQDTLLSCKRPLQGPTGATGATGATGPTGTLSQAFGSFYRDLFFDPLPPATDTPIAFLLTTESVGVNKDINNTDFTFTSPGYYLIEWTVRADNLSTLFDTQVQLFLHNLTTATTYSPTQFFSVPLQNSFSVTGHLLLFFNTTDKVQLRASAINPNIFILSPIISFVKVGA